MSLPIIITHIALCPPLPVQLAHACVTSRANYVQGHGFAMTPILDMINHDGSCGTRASIVQDELFLSVDQIFSKGDEVFISYGDLTNLETLCNYGFVVPSSSSSVVPAIVAKKNNEETIDVSIIRRPAVRVILDSDGSFDADSLATLRSYLVSPEEMERRRNMDEGEVTSRPTTTFIKPISDENEEDVFCLIYSFLIEAVTDANIGVETARSQEDSLVECYLRERVMTLEQGLAFARRKFPSLIDY